MRRRWTALGCLAALVVLVVPSASGAVAAAAVERDAGVAHAQQVGLTHRGPHVVVASPTGREHRAAPRSPHSSVVGGSPAGASSHPWYVSVEVFVAALSETPHARSYARAPPVVV